MCHYRLRGLVYSTVNQDGESRCPRSQQYDMRILRVQFRQSRRSLPGERRGIGE